MAPGGFLFDNFALYPEDRRLTCGGATVELNARYLDALVLLVRERGQLISKDRFLNEVWRGVPVTDEALTQCIKMLRRQLGDNAANPRFIETVPKHGYRFIAPVETAGAPPASAGYAIPAFWRVGSAGCAGGALAGMIGGLFYGLTVSAATPGSDTGAASIVLVLLILTILAGLVSGAGIGFAIAAAQRISAPDWLKTIAGGAAGGFIVGAAVKLISLDTFTLLFGGAPNDMTGAGEGLLLGGAVGASIYLAGKWRSLRAGVALGAGIGAAAGLIIHVSGGRLMAGSLDLLAHSFTSSRLSMDQIGVMFGEGSFGPVTQAVMVATEGALFCACMASAMTLARRNLAPGSAAHRYAAGL